MVQVVLHREKLKAVCTAGWRKTFKGSLKLPDGPATCCVSCKAVYLCKRECRLGQNCLSVELQTPRSIREWGYHTAGILPGQNPVFMTIRRVTPKYKTRSDHYHFNSTHSQAAGGASLHMPFHLSNL